MRLICFDDRGSPRHAILLDDEVLPLDALPEAEGVGLPEILGRGAAGLAALGRAAEAAPRPARLSEPCGFCRRFPRPARSSASG